jgi:two-component system nitrate/nitrite sensor histidine kinase NarX
MEIDDTQALELTYDLVATTMQEHDLDYMLSRFMHRVAGVLDADAALARLEKSGQLHLVDSHGLRPQSELMQPTISARLFRKNETPGKTRLGVRTGKFGKDLVEKDGCENSGNNDNRTLISVPLKFKGDLLGSYQFLVTSRDTLGENTVLLLENVGKHVGFLVEQHRLDKDAAQLLMVEERARMASEMHDSLAQTLASLRIQVRILDETLHQGDEQVTWEEMEKLEKQVEQANVELRSLIGKFRAPLRSREVVEAVSRNISGFREDTGINVYFQNEWDEDNLAPQLRADVIYIVQEALANIRKHADASNARVLLRHHGGDFRVMVEDDGRGMSAKADKNESAVKYPGNHVGQAVMEQRTGNLGGELRVESEPGEGTRVLLEFSFSDNIDG